jgi:ABC-type nitrate/sulfonate/bicarbonate transport system permease component
MIHTAHRFPIYRNKKHVLTSVLVILVPIILLFVAGAFAGIGWAELGSAIGMSFFRLLVAYFISLFLGVLIALLIGASRFGESFIPIFDVLQNVPSFALIPLFVIAFGYTTTMAIVFAATSIVWPILFYTLSALRNAPRELSEAAQVFGATGIQKILHYLLPLSMPAIITGSIVGLSIGWEAVIGVEIIGNIKGIGTFLTAAGESSTHGNLYIGIIAILVLVFIINKLVWGPLLKTTHRYGE